MCFQQVFLSILSVHLCNKKATIILLLCIAKQKTKNKTGFKWTDIPIVSLDKLYERKPSVIVIIEGVFVNNNNCYRCIIYTMVDIASAVVRSYYSAKYLCEWRTRCKCIIWIATVEERVLCFDAESEKKRYNLWCSYEYIMPVNQQTITYLPLVNTQP